MLIERRRVRVWFGARAIVDHVAAPELANSFAEAMQRRYASLRVTNERLPDLPMPESLVDQ
jgi:hypothetical protein